MFKALISRKTAVTSVSLLCNSRLFIKATTGTTNVVDSYTWSERRSKSPHRATEQGMTCYALWYSCKYYLQFSYLLALGVVRQPGILYIVELGFCLMTEHDVYRVRSLRKECNKCNHCYNICLYYF